MAVQWQMEVEAKLEAPIVWLEGELETELLDLMAGVHIDKNAADKWVWNVDNANGYSAKSGYTILVEKSGGQLLQTDN